MFQKFCAIMHGKNRSKKAFTLAELLIVIAIIGILIAIAVPVFSAQLTKARNAVDNANMRAIKAMAAADYVEDENLDDTTYYVTSSGDVSTTSSTGATAYTVSQKNGVITVEKGTTGK